MMKSMALRHELSLEPQRKLRATEVPVIIHFNKSVILSYLIISFTTKSLILAQDER